jgi:hypothetical protein
MKLLFITAFMFDAMATETKGGSTEIVLKAIKEHGDKTDAKIGEVQTELKGLEEDITRANSTAQKAVEAAEDAKKSIALIKNLGEKEPKAQKSFNEIIGETIEANLNDIKAFKKGDSRTIAAHSVWLVLKMKRSRKQKQLVICQLLPTSPDPPTLLQTFEIN